MYGGSSVDTHLADTLAENTMTVVGSWVIPGGNSEKWENVKIKEGNTKNKGINE